VLSVSEYLFLAQQGLTRLCSELAVTPVAAMASEAVISNSLVYVEEPEELVITKVELSGDACMDV